MTTDIVDVGERTALICEDGADLAPVRSTLEEMGFKCHVAETPERAIEQIRYTSYDVIAIGERFGGTTLEGNTVLRFLAPLSMSERRDWFVLLLGESFRTLDAMQAYAESVHVVVHPQDISNLGPILRKSLEEFHAFYRVYRGVLSELGEAA